MQVARVFGRETCFAVIAELTSECQVASRIAPRGGAPSTSGRASALICRPRIDTVTNSTTSTSATATTITITARAKLDRVIEKITDHDPHQLPLAA